MVFDDLQNRYGSYLAEMVRQVLTLEEFNKLDVETVLPYLELRAERLFKEYRQSAEPTVGTTPLRSDYRDILQRRWRDADALVHAVTSAETLASESDYLAAVGA